MNSSTNFYTSHRNSATPIMEQVYSIIDSKIQYVDYLTNQAIQPFLHNFKLQNLPNGKIDVDPNDRMVTSVNPSFLMQIEKNSKTKKLLLVVRRKLCFHNASMIFDLLTDNKYLNYTEKSLAKFLDEECFE